MPIDVRQFYQGFFDEVAEHLANLEAAAMAMDPAAPKSEEIALLFRIAHSIKGTSATFGFSAMSSVTHALETVLDRVRQGALGMSEELVDAILRTRDVLQTQLDAFRSNGGIDTEAAKGLEDELLAFGSEAAASAKHLYEIAYECFDAGKSREERFAMLCERLANIGEIPKRCESAREPVWRFTLQTPAAAEELHALCAFGADSRDAVEIVNAGARRQMIARAQEPEPAEDFGFFVPVKGDRPEQRAAMPAPAAPPPESEASTIRVRLDKVERLINLAGEMIITSSTLAQAAQRLDALEHAPLVSSVDVLERQTRELREGVMSVRMMQVGTLFARFTRVVREAAQKLGKEAVLVTSGGDTELDKGLIEQIADPLVHLIRNAIDHGIEPPGEREAGGKERRGTVRLRAAHESGRISIEVTDDGRGLRRDAILAKAHQLGLEMPADAEDAAVWRLIFTPGFSTAERVSDLSGRGVGMDVVLRNITKLGGRVDVHSRAGEGTSVKLSVPLTLAILDGLAVRSNGQTYVIPLESIVESFALSDRVRHTVGVTHQLVEFRGQQVPLVSLGGAGTPERRSIAVVVESEGRRAAVCVDELEGQHQVVVKSLEANFRKVAGLIGATVMGSGDIGFILDVPAIVPQ